MAFVHGGMHFHVNIIQTYDDAAVLVYDYTDFDPHGAIEQFAAIVSMVDGYEFDLVYDNLVTYFVEALGSEEEIYVVVGGSEMAEGIYECYEPCRVSPSMN